MVVLSPVRGGQSFINQSQELCIHERGGKSGIKAIYREFAQEVHEQEVTPSPEGHQRRDMSPSDFEVCRICGFLENHSALSFSILSTSGFQESVL